MRQDCPITPLLLNIVLEILARSLRQEKEITEVLIGKEVKLSLLEDDMRLYIGDPQILPENF